MKLVLFLLLLSMGLMSFGCSNGGGNHQYFPPDDFVCTVAFVSGSLTLLDATEGVAFSDITTLVTSTTGGVTPFTYSGTFATASNLFIASDGDITSGIAGAGTPGTYPSTVTVTDATGVCSDTVSVSIDILSSGPAAPRILSVSHLNTFAGGTDTVAGSALSGLDTVPDFLGVEGISLTSSRDFVISIDSDGDGLASATVTTTNVTIFEIDATAPGGGTLLPTTAYTVTYAPLPTDTITVSILLSLPPPAFLLDAGRSYVITVSTSVTNTSGDPFSFTPIPNSVTFLTAPSSGLVFGGLISTGAGCSGCHAGGSPGAAVSGGIAFPPGGVTSAISLDFTDSTTTGASLARENPVGRNYLTFGGIASVVGAFNPNSSVLANKLSATTAFGVPMPIGGTLDGSSAPLGLSGDPVPPPPDPDTGVIITEGKFVTQFRSWIRAGSPP
ncbi:MAG: hypothetical protein AABZ60_04915 [Planctomycetota bacterium]